VDLYSKVQNVTAQTEIFYTEVLYSRSLKVYCISRLSVSASVIV